MHLRGIKYLSSFHLVVALLFNTLVVDGRPHKSDYSKVEVVSYFSENNAPHGYQFRYSLDDGTEREEKGEFVNGIWTVTGTFTYLTKNGPEKWTFIADDRGYRASPVMAAHGLAGIENPKPPDDYFSYPPPSQGSYPLGPPVPAILDMSPSVGGTGDTSESPPSIGGGCLDSLCGWGG